MDAKVLLLPGDGIGPEVTAEAEKLITALAEPVRHEHQHGNRADRRRRAGCHR